MNLLAHCSKAFSQFRQKSEQLLLREDNIDQLVDNMLLSQKKLNKQTQLFKFQYFQETNNKFKSQVNIIENLLNIVSDPSIEFDGDYKSVSDILKLIEILPTAMESSSIHRIIDQLNRDNLQRKLVEQDGTMDGLEPGSNNFMQDTYHQQQHFQYNTFQNTVNTPNMSTPKTTPLATYDQTMYNQKQMGDGTARFTPQ